MFLSWEPALLFVSTALFFFCGLLLSNWLICTHHSCPNLAKPSFLRFWLLQYFCLHIFLTLSSLSLNIQLWVFSIHSRLSRNAWWMRNVRSQNVLSTLLEVTHTCTHTPHLHPGILPDSEAPLRVFVLIYLRNQNVNFMDNQLEYNLE